MDDDKYERCEQRYHGRNEQLQRVIDACAQRRDLDQHGVKAEIADELGVDRSRVYYVLDRWRELVRWRRSQMANPLDTDAVKAAYDDEALAEMAASGEIAADGTSQVTVPIELSLDESFRAIKLLPGDLGMKVFAQLMQKAEDLPREELMKIMRAKD